MTPRSVVVAFAILAAAIVSLTPASALGPLYGTVTGPDALAPGQAASYNLTLAGGPEGAVTYSVRWYVTGPIAAGALPTVANPTSASGNRTTFRLNVTAPAAQQTITLVVKISASIGTTFENTSVQKSIIVITPIMVSATFTNTGPTTALNVTVRFYVDGALVGTKMIARIAPGAQATATFSYLPANLQPGSHQVRVEADLDGDGTIDPTRGEVAVSSFFYRGTAPLSTGWTVLIGIGVFVPAFIVTVGLRRRERA